MTRIGLVSLLSLLTTSAIAEEKIPNIAGTWDSTYGEVTLIQRGTRVRGTYPCCGGGTLEGRIVMSDRRAVVKFHWSEPRGAGEGEGTWTLIGNRLHGSWGRNQSETDGGAWNLWRRNDQPAIAN